VPFCDTGITPPPCDVTFGFSKKLAFYLQKSRQICKNMVQNFGKNVT